MKKIVAIIAVLTLAVMSLGGCSKDMGRINYNYDMTKYVELDSYEVEVDSGNETYKEYYSEKVTELLNAEITEGKVENGDIVNIDYVGKKDGVAFDGGTANGYDLEIGSGSFIPGFEDGLIGKEIGTTVDLPLTFPSDYSNSAELAGKDVVFTVKINHKKLQYEELNDENAIKCGYKSAAELGAEAEKYAVEGAAWEILYDKAKIEKYPEKESEALFDFIMYNMERQINSTYGVGLEQYAQYMGSTLKELKETIKSGNDLASFNHNYMLAYYILDISNTKLDKELFNERLKLYGEETVRNIGREYVEATVAVEQAMDIVAQKATLKK